MDEEAFNFVFQDLFPGPDHEFGPEETETTVSILPALAEMSSPVFDWNQLLTGSATEAALPAGGGRVIEEESKKSENGTKVMEEDNETEESMENGSDGSFFDCSICLDLSKDPVVTNCGHLYCWSCLYEWLKVSVAKQCPVCKGKICVETLTPIYGSGKSQELSDTNKNIPSRPKAKRIESQRNVRQRPSHIQERIEREFSTEDRRTRPFLNRFMFSRGVSAEQNQSSAALVAPVDNRRASSQLRARWFPTENVIVNQMENNVPSLGLEDRDSISSIVGVTNSEYQVDTAGEIVSMFTYANGSRVSDVDSADSHPLWSRR